MQKYFLLFLIALTGQIFVQASKFAKIDLNNPDIAQMYEHYLEVSGYSYDEKEKPLRFQIFRSTVEAIKTHISKRGESFSLGLNKFSDKTQEEFQKVLGFIPPPSNQNTMPSRSSSSSSSTNTINSWSDLRMTTSCVTDIRDQGQCGSCYAFATADNLDMTYCRTCNNSVKYTSPQKIMDCCSGTYGCNGGWMDVAVNCVKDFPGTNLLSDYPYTATDGTCQVKDSTAVYRKVMAHNPVTTENGMMQMLANAQPLYGAIVVDTTFQLYSGGVFGNIAICKKASMSAVNHAIGIVGYGTDSASGKNYWLVKNSWGADWGEQGYIRIWRNNNCLQICNYAGYASVNCD